MRDDAGTVGVEQAEAPLTDARADHSEIAEVQQVTRCPTCHAKIMEMPTQYGIPVRIDPEPSPTGNVRIEKSRATVLGDGQAALAREAGEQLYSIHPKYCQGGRK